ncbi:TetR/AcrR family transcriptional regulator [Actinokineospora sp. G85]|uniref:TetR/AcrR family transcriptional regulator n=1 Tax=Actinokineospora sp. G85 TaxID=3406626 RepID=UPI003C769C39
MARTKGFDPDAAVTAAMELFWANGYAGTTPRQLVDALGIGRGSLYNAFESKHALFERALRRYYEVNTARLFEVLAGPGSAVARLRAALDLVVESARTEARGCLITNTATEVGDESVAAFVRRVFDEQEAAFAAVVAEGVERGEIAGDRDPAATAAFLLATINGIRVLAKADPTSPRLTTLAETALRAI